jgi:hypothetical protein
MRSTTTGADSRCMSYRKDGDEVVEETDIEIITRDSPD